MRYRSHCVLNQSISSKISHQTGRELKDLDIIVIERKWIAGKCLDTNVLLMTIKVK